MPKRNHKELVKMPSERIVGMIFLVRGSKVILDKDLAELYRVETKTLNQAVRRNVKRFPNDFVFRLTKQEAEILRSQIVTSNSGRGGRRYLPHAFTEQGVAMLSSVLQSERAIQVNIQIIRTFTKLREMLSAHKDLKQKIEEMERKYDKRFRDIFEAIKLLLVEKEKPKRPMGF